jgi:hypothetical protein
MILDVHIHIHGGAEGRAEFAGRLRAAGVDGGVLISESPATPGTCDISWASRRRRPRKGLSGQGNDDRERLNGTS